MVDITPIITNYDWFFFQIALNYQWIENKHLENRNNSGVISSVKSVFSVLNVELFTVISNVQPKLNTACFSCFVLLIWYFMVMNGVERRSKQTEERKSIFMQTIDVLFGYRLLRTAQSRLNLTRWLVWIPQQSIRGHAILKTYEYCETLRVDEMTNRVKLHLL